MSRPSTYLLRVRLPDQPGVLGKVASALGAAGADIDSIAVIDRADGYAVDDLVVSLPAASLADRLVTAATSVGGVTVETVQRHHGRLRIHDDLALLDAAARSTEPLATLVGGLADLLHASYAFVAVRDADAPAARMLATTSAVPDVACRAAWLPLPRPSGVSPARLWDDPDVAGPDCELVAAPYEASSAVVLGRIGGPAFRSAELTRLAHLARFARALLADSDIG